MDFVGTTDGLLAAARGPHDSILTPLAFYPYLLWRIDEARTDRSLVRLAELERWDDAATPPDWVLYVPKAFLRAEVKARVEALLGSGLYEPVFAGGADVGALYVRQDHRLGLARLDPPR